MHDELLEEEECLANREVAYCRQEKDELSREDLCYQHDIWVNI